MKASYFHKLLQLFHPFLSVILEMFIAVHPGWHYAMHV